jgi:hypothetical protein
MQNQDQNQDQNQTQNQGNDEGWRELNKNGQSEHHNSYTQFGSINKVVSWAYQGGQQDFD